MAFTTFRLCKYYVTNKLTWLKSSDGTAFCFKSLTSDSSYSNISCPTSLLHPIGWATGDRMWHANVSSEPYRLCKCSDRIEKGYTYEIFDRNAPSTGEFVNGRNSSPPNTSVIHNFQVHSDLQPFRFKFLFGCSFKVFWEGMSTLQFFNNIPFPIALKMNSRIHIFRMCRGANLCFFNWPGW